MATNLLEIPWDAEGIVLSRPNRFLAIVDIPEKDLRDEKVHVHDPGRLEELLWPGNKVLLKRVEKEGRKTKWDVIAALWPGQPVDEPIDPRDVGEYQWILIHSGYHRAISEQILSRPDICPFGELKTIRSEVKVGNSRMDFLLELKAEGEQPNDSANVVKENEQNGRENLKTGRMVDGEVEEIMVEVKGCSLTVDGIALFPDAPTERGRRHLDTLTRLRSSMRTAILILILRRDSECFAPNADTDPKFAETFNEARKAGVEVYPALLEYRDSSILFHRFIPVCE